MRKTILLIFVLIFSYSISAQENLKIKIPSTVLIKGTSTLHDWESVVEKTDAQLKLTDNVEPSGIETLNVTVEVESIKSGKKTMDKLTYKALKSEDHPYINFVFKKGEIIKQNKEFVDIKLMGDLTIGGVTKNVSVKTQINKLGKTISLKGSHKLKMTDFDIEPPTALLGTIKTGDEITIDFNLTFE